MSLKQRVERLEAATSEDLDAFIERLVERTRWLPPEQVRGIEEMVAADLAGEDVGETHPEALEALEQIYQEVRREFAEAH